jgi:hypothetical protein
MLYLRTASGSFISSTIIVGLAPQHAEDGKIAGWMAIRADGSTTPLAAFFSAPGRIEKALPHLFPEPTSEPVAAPAPRRRYVVVRTAKPGRIAADSACSSADCCGQLS